VTPPILTVGLTGGIASGKSTVAGFLRDHGALVLDADRIARDVVAPHGPAHAEVVARFGRDVLDAGGGIDRARLGAIVFADVAARRDLEAIVHPRVREEIRRRLAGGDAPHGIAVIEAALLVETGGHREYHRLVVVRAERATQLRRLQQRDRYAPDEATRRVDAQAPLADKLAVADYVIDGDVDLDRTRQETAAVWRHLLADRDALVEGHDLPPTR
jgi:dephospho-CoA kinase